MISLYWPTDVDKERRQTGQRNDNRSDHYPATCTVGAQPEGKANACEEPDSPAAEPVSRFRGGD